MSTEMNEFDMKKLLYSINVMPIMESAWNILSLSSNSIFNFSTLKHECLSSMESILILYKQNGRKSNQEVSMFIKVSPYYCVITQLPSLSNFSTNKLTEIIIFFLHSCYLQNASFSNSVRLAISYLATNGSEIVRF